MSTSDVAERLSVEKRLQLIAMCTCSLYFMMPMIVACWCLAAILLRFPYTALPMTFYMGWVFLVDKSSVTGQRRPLFRGSWWWAYACDYYPILLVKTADLDPTKTYVMGYHPHGIISIGAFGAFATDGPVTMALHNSTETDKRGFSALYPGIDRRLITLPQNFTTPFVREFILGMGCCDSSKETFRTVLARGAGIAIVVVVGGAAESMIATPGEIDLVLETRRGFVREAIMAGACLVPIISYGENDVYKVFKTDEKHWIFSFQQAVKHYTGVAMPIFQGRSFLFKDFGLMPKRHPVCVVVGAPIEPPAIKDRASFLPQIDRETQQPLNEDGKILEEHHTKYINALMDLYKKHKTLGWNQAGKGMRGTLKIQ
jgi:2-acylglycerol O-acyltransferase 2